MAVTNKLVRCLFFESLNFNHPVNTTNSKRVGRVTKPAKKVQPPLFK